jgi:outer membrane murein-binding lipoprotein Lpp
MKNKIIVSIVLLGIIVLAGMVSCGQGDIQEKYDILAAQYAEANNQLAELQEKMYEAQILQTQFDELSAQYDALQNQNDASLDIIASLGAEVEELGDEIDALNADIEAKTSELADWIFQYDELKAEYDALVGQGMEITEENIELALFDLINQERISNGLNALNIGHNLEAWSLINSQRMAYSKEYEYYVDYWVPFQKIFIAVGYNSLDGVVNAAMKLWQSNALSYEENILNEDALYGAISAVKSGDIYYITFMASNFP